MTLRRRRVRAVRIGGAMGGALEGRPNASSSFVIGHGVLLPATAQSRTAVPVQFHAPVASRCDDPGATLRSPALPLRANVIQLGDGVEREPPRRVAQRDGAHAAFRVALQF
jgi:hypothetical protein